MPHRVGSPRVRIRPAVSTGYSALPYVPRRPAVEEPERARSQVSGQRESAGCAISWFRLFTLTEPPRRAAEHQHVGAAEVRFGHQGARLGAHIQVLPAPSRAEGTGEAPRELGGRLAFGIDVEPREAAG